MNSQRLGVGLDTTRNGFIMVDAGQEFELTARVSDTQTHTSSQDTQPAGWAATHHE